MKKRFPLAALIAGIIIITFDVISFILIKEYHKLNILGLCIINVAFISYILVKLFVKKPEGERGIRPLDIALVFYCIITTILAIISFVIDEKAFLLFLIINIIIFALIAVLVVFGIFTKEHIKAVDAKNKIILSNSELVDTLNQVKDFIAEENVKIKIADLAYRIKEAEIDVDSETGKKIKEYVTFIYRDAANNNINNVLFNINNIEKLLK